MGEKTYKPCRLRAEDGDHMIVEACIRYADILDEALYVAEGLVSSYDLP